MSDFDKVQSSDKSAEAAKRKQILVGVLGALLLAIVGFHFLKGSPTQAEASGMPSLVAGGGSSNDTPLTAMAKLQADPTANLLTGSPVLDPTLADIPHDPFRPSEKLTKLITKEPTLVLPKVEPTHETVAPTAAKVIAANSLKVDGIIRINKNLTAIIGGSMVNVGMTVGDAYVVDIQEGSVTVRHKDFPDGPTTTLSLAPKMK